MQKPDQLRVTADQNPALIEATRDMAIGDKITFDVHGTLKARDAEGVDITVEAVVPEGYELDEEAAEPQSVPGLSSSDAMMTPTAMMVKRKDRKSSPPNPSA